MLTALIWITDKIQRGEIPLDRADWAFLMFSAYGVFRLTGDRKESHHETIKCIADGNMKTQLHVFPILKCFLLSHFNVQGQLHDWISQHSGHDISQRKGMLWALYKLRSIDRICDNVHYHKRKKKKKRLYFIFLIIIIMLIIGFTEALTMLANGASLFFFIFLMYLCFCKQKCHHIHVEIYLTTRSPSKSSQLVTCNV